MAKLYKIIPPGFSFKKVDGYNQVLPRTIGAYFEHSRSIGTDLFVVKHYKQDGSVTELMRGYVPTEPDGTITPSKLKELTENQKTLLCMIDQAAPAAKDAIKVPRDIYQERRDCYNAVFVKSVDGVFGCGWYDNEGTAKKGLKLAAFVVYAFAMINSEIDKDLWEASFRYLPYDSELGRADKADEIIMTTLEEAVIARNNSATKIVEIKRPDNN